MTTKLNQWLVDLAAVDADGSLSTMQEVINKATLMAQAQRTADANGKDNQ